MCIGFGLYTDNGHERVECGCGQWICENHMEDLYVDANGQQIFYPFCLIIFLAVFMFQLEKNCMVEFQSNLHGAFSSFHEKSPTGKNL